tara:strand:+ start:128 stop:307 length:180 start_codon:yes stop_codon:yes gene_type:complete
MNKSNGLKGSYFQSNENNGENRKIIDSQNKSEKVLCTHCGRTANNGIRCLGMCVADNDY